VRGRRRRRGAQTDVLLREKIRELNHRKVCRISLIIHGLMSLLPFVILLLPTPAYFFAIAAIYHTSPLSTIFASRSAVLGIYEEVALGHEVS
jgi:hypothetical protein